MPQNKNKTKTHVKHYLHYLTWLVTASSFFLHCDCLPNRKSISIMCILCNYVCVCVYPYVCVYMCVLSCILSLVCVCVCLFGLCEIFTLERSVVFRMSLSLSFSPFCVSLSAVYVSLECLFRILVINLSQCVSSARKRRKRCVYIAYSILIQILILIWSN